MFKTVRVLNPPMSSVPPASDAVIAQRTSKYQLQMHTLLEGERDIAPKKSWQIEQVKKNIMRKFDKLMKEHSEQTAAFERWIAAGRPDLDEEGQPLRPAQSRTPKAPDPSEAL